MTERFKKTYDALYNAFMTDTLAKGTCTACAVGNIVAAAQGGTVKKDLTCDTENKFWGSLFFTDVITGKQHKGYIENAQNIFIIEKKEEFEKLTGYTVEEMAQVEWAFETNTTIDMMEYPEYYRNNKDHKIMEDQFNGLMAVMDVLIKLDEVEKGQEYKDTFKNKFQTV
jgi:hypothetical protein